MKIKAIMALLAGAFVSSAFAGEWCPPECEAKCPVECCESSGSVSVGYDTAYIWKGVRWANDSVWADANYTFDSLPLSPNIGVWHLSSLGSGAPSSDAYGDEFNLYAGVTLPSICGFDSGLGYTWYAFPTTRLPSGSPANGGDSLSSLTFSVSRELFCGVSLDYAVDYFMGNGGNAGVDNGLTNFFHTIGLGKSIDINDCMAIDLAGFVTYNDGLWSGTGTANTGSGWNSYNLSASLPIALNACATLTPYVSYNGTPDGWVADGLNGGIPGGNANDVFYGGVSLSVGF